MNKIVLFVCGMLFACSSDLSALIITSPSYESANNGFGWKPVSAATGNDFSLTFTAAATISDVQIGFKTAAGTFVSIAVGGASNTCTYICEAPSEAALYTPSATMTYTVNPGNGNSAIIPALNASVEYSVSINKPQGSGDGVLAVLATVSGQAPVQVASYSSPVFAQAFVSYSFRTFGSSVLTITNDAMSDSAQVVSSATAPAIVSSPMYASGPGNYWGWKAITSPGNNLSFVFTASAASDLSLALAYSTTTTTQYVELVIGAAANTRSVVRTYVNGVKGEENIINPSSVGLGSAIIPDTANPVAYTLQITPASGSSDCLLTVFGKTVTGQNSPILSLQAPFLNQQFNAYSFKAGASKTVAISSDAVTAGVQGLKGVTVGTYEPGAGAFGWKPLGVQGNNFALKFTAVSTASDLHIGLKYAANAYVSIHLGTFGNTKSAVRAYSGTNMTSELVVVPDDNSSAKIPALGVPVAYTVSVTRLEGATSGVLSIIGTTQAGAAFPVISCSSPMLNQTFTDYSFKTAGGQLLSISGDVAAAITSGSWTNPSIAVGDVAVLSLNDGLYLGLDTAATVTALKTSLLDPKIHFSVLATDTARGKITLGYGSSFLALAPDKLGFVLTSTNTSLMTNLDVASGSIFFKTPGAIVSFDPARFGLSSTTPITSFGFTGPLSKDQCILDLMNTSTGPLTRDLALTAFQNVFQPLISRPGKVEVDWQCIVRTFVEYVTKASVDIKDWTLPFLDVTSADGVASRISLQDYAVRLLAYVADPFSPASVSVKAMASDTLKALGTAAPAAVTTTTTKEVASLTEGAVVMLRVAAQGDLPAKPITVLDDGTLQPVASASAYSKVTHVKLAKYDPKTQNVVLSFGSKFFEKTTGKFSGATQTVSSELVLEPIAGSTSYYLNDASPSLRLKIPDSALSAVSFGGSDATMFDIVPLAQAEWMLDSLKAPANAADLDAALGLFATAFQAASGKADDLISIVTYLGLYCQQALGLPDWGYVMSGKTVSGVSPRDYVKTLLSNVTTLKQRYPGVTAEVQAVITAILGSSSFVPAVPLSEGKVGVFKLPSNMCLSVVSKNATESASSADAASAAPAATGAAIVGRQSFTSPVDPATHFKILTFNGTTGEIKLAAGANKIVSQAGVFSCTSAGDPTTFKVVPDAQGVGYNLLDSSNKKLRWQDSGAVFGDMGDVASFVLITDKQALLGGLVGSLAPDLNLFNRMFQAMKESSVDLACTTSVLGTYISQQNSRLEWTSTTKINASDPEQNARDFAINLIKCVRDMNSYFKGVTPEIKKQLEDVLNIAQDMTPLFGVQIAQLDGLAVAVAAPADLADTSPLIVLLKTLVPGVASTGSADQRDVILSKLDTYYDSKVITALGKSIPMAQRNAWIKRVFSLAAQILAFDASTSTDLFSEKLGYVKTWLYPRLQKLGTAFGATVQASAMLALLDPHLKTVAKEATALGVSGVVQQGLRQILTNMSNTLQQLNLPQADKKPLSDVMSQVMATSGVSAARSRQSTAGGVTQAGDSGDAALLSATGQAANTAVIVNSSSIGI